MNDRVKRQYEMSACARAGRKAKVREEKEKKEAQIKDLTGDYRYRYWSAIECFQKGFTVAFHHHFEQMISITEKLMTLGVSHIELQIMPPTISGGSQVTSDYDETPMEE